MAYCAVSSRAALDRLPEGGRIFERKALLAERVAKAHPGAVSPALAPRWPSSISTRLLPSKASTATVLSPISSRILLMSMISTALPANSPRPSLLNSSAECRRPGTPARCWRLSPSLGVSRMMRLSSRLRPCFPGSADTGECWRASSASCRSPSHSRRRAC